MAPLSAVEENNDYGLICEDVLVELLPEIGIPHKFQAGGSREWHWRASRFEDLCPELGIDIWVTTGGYEDVSVDVTIISESNPELLEEKVNACLERGVIPLVLEQGLLMRAKNGSRRALQELGLEVRGQITLKLGLLKGERMTRERAARLKKKVLG